MITEEYFLYFSSIFSRITIFLQTQVLSATGSDPEPLPNNDVAEADQGGQMDEFQKTFFVGANVRLSSWLFDKLLIVGSLNMIRKYTDSTGKTDIKKVVEDLIKLRTEKKHASFLLHQKIMLKLLTSVEDLKSRLLRKEKKENEVQDICSELSELQRLKESYRRTQTENRDNKLFEKKRRRPAPNQLWIDKECDIFATTKQKFLASVSLFERRSNNRDLLLFICQHLLVGLVCKLLNSMQLGWKILLKEETNGFLFCDWDEGPDFYGYTPGYAGNNFYDHLEVVVNFRNYCAHVDDIASSEVADMSGVLDDYDQIFNMLVCYFSYITLEKVPPDFSSISFNRC